MPAPTLPPPRPGGAYALHRPGVPPAPPAVVQVVVLAHEPEFGSVHVVDADGLRSWEAVEDLLGPWRTYAQVLALADGARRAGLSLRGVHGDAGYGEVVVRTDLSSLVRLLAAVGPLAGPVVSASVRNDPDPVPGPDRVLDPERVRDPVDAPAAATGTGPAGLVVAVDGPSGSGKSTVCRRVAAVLGLRYLDTGAMYRALTWWALERGVDLDDQPAVAALAADLPLDLGQDPSAPYVRVGGTDVSAGIRETRISEAVSAVAGNLAVRAELVRRQRALVATGGVVAEGRDITTVVAPDAPVRILLTAREDARLARRAREVHGTTDASALAATRDQVLARDARDSRVARFLDAADDGVVQVDSSDMGVEETVGTVLEVVARLTGVRAPAGAGARERVAP